MRNDLDNKSLQRTADRRRRFQALSVPIINLDMDQLKE